MLGIYLNFNGNCKAALAMYEKAFDAKTTVLSTYSDMPADPNFPIKDSDKDLVIHSVLVVYGMEIMCSDLIFEQVTTSNKTYISINIKDEEKLKDIWNVLKEDGKIHTDLQPTFFALQHGSLQDKFGVNWMFTAVRPKN